VESTTQYYIRVRGTVLGPYDLGKLQSLVRRGQLGRMHEVSTDGAIWNRASNFAELFAGTTVVPAARSTADASRMPAVLPPEAGTYAVAGAPGPGSMTGGTTPRLPQWYYARGASQHGPVDQSMLEELLANGQVGPDDQVWCEGTEEWLPARQHPRLLDVVKPKKAAKLTDVTQPSGELPDGLCQCAAGPRGWIMTLVVFGMITAALNIFAGILYLILGGRTQNPGVVIGGLFWLIWGFIQFYGAWLLLDYAKNLAGLNFSRDPAQLQKALASLESFWRLAALQLICTLAFIILLVAAMALLGASIMPVPAGMFPHTA